MIEYNDAEKFAIDLVMSRFFAMFSNKDGEPVSLERLNDMFIDGGVIVKTCGEPPSIYDIHDFITLRQRLLNDGELENFSEEELWEKTDIFGDVAQRFCLYRKSGVLSGKKFETQGMKSIQLINTEAGWKISAVAWDDEREGVSIPVIVDEIKQVTQDKVTK